MQFQPIGVIHSVFTEPSGVPIQPRYAKGVEGTVEVFEPFAEGLRDLEGFERIWLIYWFHKAPPARLVVVPFKDQAERGVFATRAPCRPNPIGLSCVRLLGVQGKTLAVAEVDVLDGTPLLDIKPYAPQFDHFQVKRVGWLGGKTIERGIADGRFATTEEG
jgi:tRNA-Thr(GGU) m(6)t(6)A37 methyltransferase TsaA